MSRTSSWVCYCQMETAVSDADQSNAECFKAQECSIKPGTSSSSPQCAEVTLGGLQLVIPLQGDRALGWLLQPAALSLLPQALTSSSSQRAWYVSWAWRQVME